MHLNGTKQLFDETSIKTEVLQLILTYERNSIRFTFLFSFPMNVCEVYSNRALAMLETNWVSICVFEFKLSYELCNDLFCFS